MPMPIQQHTPFQVRMTRYQNAFVKCKKQLALGIHRNLTRYAEAEAKKGVLHNSKQIALHDVF